MSVDLWQSAVDAMYGLVEAAITDTDVPVYQSLPQNPLAGSFVMIADMDGDPAGGKFAMVDRLTVDIHFVYRGPDGREGLRTLMWAARQALQNKEIAADGASFSPVSWIGGNTATAQDGTTFVGVHQFQVTAEPA